MIRGTDGYDYEDLAARLLDRRADSPRNRHLEHAAYLAYLEFPLHAKLFIATHRETYDYHEALGQDLDVCARAATAQARLTSAYVRDEDREASKARISAQAGSRFAATRSVASFAESATAAHCAAAGPAGAGGADPGQAPADPVHAAD